MSHILVSSIKFADISGGQFRMQALRPGRKTSCEYLAIFPHCNTTTTELRFAIEDVVTLKEVSLSEFISGSFLRPG